jgi:hypothetical protein
VRNPVSTHEILHVRVYHTLETKPAPLLVADPSAPGTVFQLKNYFQKIEMCFSLKTSRMKDFSRARDLM